MNYSGRLATTSLLAGIGLVACATPPQPFEVIHSGAQTGVRANSSQANVVTDKFELAELFKSVTSRQLPVPDLPTVDFSKDIAIYVSRDPKPSGGYGLKVRSVKCDGGVMKVDLQEVNPQGIANQAQVITQPYVLLTTARCQKMVQVEVSGADFAAPRPMKVAPK
jgi:PrcB C-terminal